MAINAAAVAALLLGLASSLAVMGTILLVIPVAALVVAWIAIVQIRHSAGTEAGTGLAAAGLLLAAGFVVMVGGRAVLQAWDVRREQGQIIALIDQFGRNIREGKYDAAWDQCNGRFHEVRKKDSFVTFWTRAQADSLYGRVKDMHWNGLLRIEIDRESGNTTALGMIIIDLESGDKDPRGARFRKEEGRWLIEDVSIDFGPAMPGGAAR